MKEASLKQGKPILDLLLSLSHDEIQNLIRNGDLLKAIAKTKRRPKNPKELFDYIMYGIIKSPKGKVICPPEGMDPVRAIEILEAVVRGDIDVASYFELREAIAEFKRFYLEVFKDEIPADKIENEFSGLVIPKSRDDLNSLIVMLEGLTHNQLYVKCGERFDGKVWKIYSDLDAEIIKFPRDTTKSYAILTRGGQEADEIYQNKSPDKCREEGLNIVTAKERMIKELFYNWKTGDHLDRKTATITSSVDSYGHSVLMHWSDVDGKFNVDYLNPRSSDPDWRAREAVSE